MAFAKGNDDHNRHGICHTLRRAPLNFLNLEMLQEIQELLESLGDSPQCRALVLDSDCAAFCAGLEMAEQTEDSPPPTWA